MNVENKLVEKDLSDTAQQARSFVHRARSGIVTVYKVVGLEVMFHNLYEVYRQLLVDEASSTGLSIPICRIIINPTPFEYTPPLPRQFMQIA